MPSDAQAAQSPPAGAAPPGAAPAGPVYDPVKLGERYEIIPGAPIPGLNSPGGAAFTARGLRDKRIEPFAVICSGAVLPRSDVASTIANLDTGAVMRLLEWGVVDWPPDKCRRYALVFEKPAGRRLMNSMTDVFEPMAEDHVTRVILTPIVHALREMSNRGVTHGGVRPTNMYYKDLTAANLVMGECVSSPAGYAQPVLFETIERGMAAPAGRGHGSAADDMYSLGVTLLVLLLGRNPLGAMEDEQILQAKIERGSYPALVGQVRLPLAITEVVRGLLVDDSRQRWTVNDLDLWLSGRRLSPKQPQVARRAARPLEFQGQDLWFARTAARALGRNPAVSTPIIENGELDKWLRRSLGDDARADVVAQAVQTASAASKGGSVADRLVARVCMALDPAAPIRYKNKPVMIDGIGAALAEAFLRGDNPQPVAEIIGNQLPMFWANVQSDFKPEFVPLVQMFDQLRGFLDRSAPGLGLERVLYEMNPSMPCASPMTIKYYPLTPAEMLRALEWTASGPDRPREPMDRHIAAFIACRHKKNEEMMLNQLGQSTEPMRRNIAMLTLLSDVQNRAGVEGLPHLCAWMVSLLEPAFKRFHNRPKQAEVRRLAEAAAHHGRLSDLLKICDDQDSITRDRKGFDEAQRSFREATSEIDKLKGTIANRNSIVEGTGRQAAAVIASLLAAVLMAVIVFYSTL
jgi:eukaryotic-like serine/threonine-protein kinase